MNRWLNNEARAQAEIAIHKAGIRGVRLHGGPMDGWLIGPDAEALSVDWYMTWPPTVRELFAPGRYDLDPSAKWATWREWESSAESESMPKSS